MTMVKKKAATKKVAKKKVVKKKVLKKKKNTKKEETTNSNLETEADDVSEIERKASVVIQSAFRGYQTRKSILNGDLPAKKSNLSFGTEETSVKVVVRVRPFIGREKKLGAKKCITLHRKENALTIKDLGGKKQPKKFTFDCLLGDKSPQSEMFENGPRQIIEKTLVGFNGTVFCYGQTGSGKTFSMYGTKQEPGIVFQANQFIQQFIDQQKGTGKKYKREVTFIEIYCERLKDLLVNPEKGVVPPKLTIRDDPKEGIFIENVVRKEIKNSDELEAMLKEGQKLRTVAATEMNSESSRSHSVVGIHITIETPGNPSPQTSTLYLVDLAGSEKAGAMNKAGAMDNTQLREGIKINLSLGALGRVIKALCAGEKHIPYRSSPLTLLLKDSLGGNSMTMMIANMSPADTNYANTLSTLQYANRIKMKMVKKKVVKRKVLKKKKNTKKEETTNSNLETGADDVSEIHRKASVVIQSAFRGYQTRESTMNGDLTAKSAKIAQLQEEMAELKTELKQQKEELAFMRHLMDCFGQNGIWTVQDEDVAHVLAIKKKTTMKLPPPPRSPPPSNQENLSIASADAMDLTLDHRIHKDPEHLLNEKRSNRRKKEERERRRRRKRKKEWN